MQSLSETEHYASFAAGMHLDGILENGMWKDGFNIHKKWGKSFCVYYHKEMCVHHKYVWTMPVEITENGPQQKSTFS